MSEQFIIGALFSVVQFAFFLWIKTSIAKTDKNADDLKLNRQKIETLKIAQTHPRAQDFLPSNLRRNFGRLSRGTSAGFVVQLQRARPSMDDSAGLVGELSNEESCGNKSRQT